MPFRTPLAWHNLLHDKARLLTSLGGMGFAIVIMFLQMGFLNGVYDSQTHVVQLLNADLMLISTQQEAVLPAMQFPRKRLIQARACPGIVAAFPLYVEEFHAAWKNARDGHECPILVFGFNPADPVFLIPEVAAQANDLKEPDTALIDNKSKDLYGALTPGAPAELSRRRIRVVGTFPLGCDFRVDGTVVVSDHTFFKCFADPRHPGTEAGRVTFGLLKAAPQADLIAVRDAVRRALPGDVRVLTRQEFADQVRTYWATVQPIGYVFGLGTLVGFAIGVIICYQILYTGIMDRLPQYATLKAIGYSNRYLVKTVLLEANYLALLSFLPALLCSAGLYALLEHIAGTLMRLTPGRVLVLLLFTVAMATFSGLLAMRKLIRSDPAEVF
jgi:putative ABC transport system permease protein